MGRERPLAEALLEAEEIHRQTARLAGEADAIGRKKNPTALDRARLAHIQEVVEANVERMKQIHAEASPGIARLNEVAARVKARTRRPFWRKLLR